MTEELRQDLLARWSGTHRKHHTVAHLHEMLDAIGRLAESGIEFDREAVELAAWFHDAIYEIGRDDNEDRSAELLGSDALRYRTYAAAVREEYTDVPDEVLNPLARRCLAHCSTGRCSTRQRGVSGGSSSPNATSKTRLVPSPATSSRSGRRASGLPA
jgi:predicted metal-dependent HD superfamily phosphohydrolase